jgi:hypothetical protein
MTQSPPNLGDLGASSGGMTDVETDGYTLA